VKYPTNGGFTSAKALTGAISGFIDWNKALVEPVVRERQEKIPLTYETS
jgi:hypothetical protein